MLSSTYSALQNASANASTDPTMPLVNGYRSLMMGWKLLWWG